MSPSGLAMSPAFWIVLKASVVLAVAAFAQAAWQTRVSAATRHLVWTLAISGLLLLPVLSLVLPDWPVVIRTAPTSVAERATPVTRADTAPSVAPAASSLARPIDAAPTAWPSTGLEWPRVMAGVYLGGVFALVILLGRQWWNVRRFVRDAPEVRDPDWTRLFTECVGSLRVGRPVRLLRSRERSMPMAVGVRRPAILIPAVADTWSENRRRAVLLHELAHVARYDCLTQTLAFAACALYRFHPAAWWAARRLRVERELACDDRVIAAGTEAREYAGHLLDIAYALGRYRAPALAVAMARPRQLEGRMLAVLDPARNRRAPAARTRVMGAAIAAALLLPLAAVTTRVVAADPVASPVPATDAARHDETLPQSHAGDGSLQQTAKAAIRAAAAAVGIHQDGVPGTWEVRPTNRAGIVHIRLVEWNSSSGYDIPLDRLEGLTGAQLTGAGGPVKFRLQRDAGTFTFDGVAHNGVAGGTFAFTPDPAFAKELAKRGFAEPTAGDQYQLARHDIGYAFLDELNRQGYAKPAIADLVRAGQHGVQATYLHDMGALGYRLGSLDPLITLRDHGVTPDYVRGLADQGYKGLSADDLRQARDHGVTPDYVRGMREAGYTSFTMEQLIRARDHGVDPEFVRGLAGAGYSKLALDDLLHARDHGVTPDYLKGMRDAGYTSLPLVTFVNARDHGVDVEFTRGMAAQGYGREPIESLIRLRDHGVTPDYAQQIKALGYDRLTTDDLVMLRDHGLTPERIRAANARAGTRLPLDMLRSIADGAGVRGERDRSSAPVGQGAMP